MNSSRDISPNEQALSELIELWHTSDPEVTLVEFLYLKPEEYAAYVEGKLTAEAVMDNYNARSK